MYKRAYSPRHAKRKLNERGEIVSNLIMISVMVLVAAIVFGAIAVALRQRGEATADCIAHAGTSQAAIEACKQANGTN